MPLPSGFTLTSKDCSSSEQEAHHLELQYNIDFASFVGSLIYLGMMQTDILYAVNKLAKYTRKPGKITSRPSFIYYVISDTIPCMGYDIIVRLGSHQFTKCCSIKIFRSNIYFLDSQTLPGTTTRIQGIALVF
jgi:hypothetical protein